MAIASARYVYCGIYGDKLYRTTENLTKWGSFFLTLRDC
jgi:hypothetical protein